MSRRTIPLLDLDLDVDDGLDGSTLEADGVDGLEQRVRVRSLSGDEEVVDLLGGQGTLQELSVEVVLKSSRAKRQLGGLSMIARARGAGAHLLDLLPRLARLGKDLGALLVPPAVTRGDQIGHPSRFRKAAKTAFTSKSSNHQPPEVVYLLLPKRR